MTVQIQVTSTEEAGTTATARGEELLWNVRLTLEYRGTSNFTIPLDFRIVGPAGAQQAKDAAYAELRRFLNEAIAEVGTRGTVS
jgi:hypothetical protein